MEDGAGGRLARFFLMLLIAFGFIWIYAVQLVNPESSVTKFIQKNFLNKEIEAEIPNENDETTAENKSNTLNSKEYVHTLSDDYRDFFESKPGRPLPRNIKNTPPAPVVIPKVESPKIAVISPLVQPEISTTNTPTEKINLPDKPATLSIRSQSHYGDKILIGGQTSVPVFSFGLLANNQAVLLESVTLENDLDNNEQVDNNGFETAYKLSLYDDRNNFLAKGVVESGKINFSLQSPWRLAPELQQTFVVRADINGIDRFDERLKKLRLSIDKNTDNNGIVASEERSDKKIMAIAGDAIGSTFVNTKTVFEAKPVPNQPVLLSEKNTPVFRFSVQAGQTESYIRRLTFFLRSSTPVFAGALTPSSRDLDLYQYSSSQFLGTGTKKVVTIQKDKVGQYSLNFIQPVLRLNPQEVLYFEIRYNDVLSLQNRSTIISQLGNDSSLYTGDMARNRAQTVWSDVSPSEYLSGYLLDIDTKVLEIF